MATFYVYGSRRKDPGRRKYLGLVKAKKPRLAMKKAKAKWPKYLLDVIWKKYIADKRTGAMTGPKKEK